MSPILRQACMTLSPQLSGIMPGGGGSGALLEAHQHLHLRAEHIAIELDRFLAAAAEEQIRLDQHLALLSPVRDLPARDRSRFRCHDCVHRPQVYGIENGRCPHMDDDDGPRARNRRRAARIGTAICAGRCWRPASRWRRPADPTRSCCARRRDAPGWCRMPPTGTSRAGWSCCRRCAWRRCRASRCRSRPSSTP